MCLRYYPYYYAPLASTFSNVDVKYASADFNVDSQPLEPFEQMMATFPSEYAQYLPEKWRPLMSDESPIFDLYQSDPVSDPNGKRHADQYVIKLPFFDEQRLSKALESIDSTLSADEQRRNRRDDDRLFVHSFTHVNVFWIKTRFDRVPGETIGALRRI